MRVVETGDDQKWACVIDEDLNVESIAEDVRSIAAHEWRPSSIRNDIATTLAFATVAEAEAAGARLQAELIATVDTRGLKNWTNVFECDDCDVAKVAVNDPYGTCALVICAGCNGGQAIAGPIDSPYWDEPDEDDITAYETMMSEEHRAYEDEPDEPEPDDQWSPEEEAQFRQRLTPLTRLRRWMKNKPQMSIRILTQSSVRLRRWR